MYRILSERGVFEVFEIVLYLEELFVDTNREIVLYILLANASSSGVMNALMLAEEACERSSRGTRIVWHCNKCQDSVVFL